MEGIKKLLGAYLIGTATVVAVWFIINPFFLDSIEVPNVWYVLDILMLIGLAVALVFNYDRKRREEAGRESVEPVTRLHLQVNAAFYMTAGLTILFLHNWFSLLANGPNSLDGNHQAWVIWSVVDTLLPLTLGATGCAMMRKSSA